MGTPIIVTKNKTGFMLIRRDTLEKISINKNLLLKEIQKTLNSIQNNLFRKAKDFNKRYTAKAGFAVASVPCKADLVVIGRRWIESTVGREDVPQLFETDEEPGAGT